VAERTASAAAERLATDAAAAEARPLRTEQNNVLAASLAVDAARDRAGTVSAATAADAASAVAAAAAAAAKAAAADAAAADEVAAEEVAAEEVAADEVAADEVAADLAAVTGAFAVGPLEPSEGAPSAVAVCVRLPAGRGGGLCGRRFGTTSGSRGCFCGSPPRRTSTATPFKEHSAAECGRSPQKQQRAQKSPPPSVPPIAPPRPPTL